MDRLALRPGLWIPVAIAALLAIVLWGASGPASGRSAGSGGIVVVIDPCTLLAPGEVSAVIGQPVGIGLRNNSRWTCDWQYPADGMPAIQVSITTELGRYALGDLCQPSDPERGLTVTEISGVGDGACFTEVTGPGAVDYLSFVKGHRVFTVATVLGPSASTAAIESADRALALAAVGHLSY